MREDRTTTHSGNESNGKSSLSTATHRDRVFLVGVELTDHDKLAEGDGPHWSIDDSISELRQLATTAGGEVIGSATQRLRSPNPRYYLGSGKVAELHELKIQHNIDLFVFDDDLSPSQHNNLERELSARVIDRHGLILTIFAQRARTHEGRLQVELAQYEYMLPRLTGQWSHLERQRGGIDVRGGPGETQLEVDRRQIRNRISDLKRELSGVRQHRAHARARRARAGMPVVALVGYTNAGKSTVMNALSRARLDAEDKLFATLDPTTRRVRLPSAHEILLSDTVGFIQKLPSELVAAFRATLEELESADVLVHIVDVSHPAGIDQAGIVKQTLAELGLADRPVVTALNKIDRFAESIDSSGRPIFEPDVAGQLDEIRQAFPNAVLVSATRGWGLTEMLEQVDQVLRDEMLDVTVRLPYSEGKLAALFRLRGSVDQESYGASAIVIRGKIPVALEPMFQPYAEERQGTRRGRGRRR